MSVPQSAPAAAAPSEASLQEAYARGKQEAADYFKSMIPDISAEVYHDAGSRIEQLHLESVEKEKKLVGVF